jgi:F0F1-type ATP synthase assembly protein I
LPLISGKYARSMAMAMEIPMSPIAGGIFGHYIDVYFHTTQPWFTGILAFFGFIHSILTLIRIAREIPPKPEP